MIVGQQSFRGLVLLLPILSAAVLARCIRISQPFVDMWSWRQADVATIAENFYRNGFNILYPQINWAGHHPGYVGTEFPLVPFIASVLYLFFGIHEWIGRSVSLLFYTLSMPFFYSLVKITYNQRSAIFATLLYSLIPLSIVSSRSFMPDMASLSFSIVALYLFVLWIKKPTTHSKLFVLAVTMTSLAISVKLPALIIGIPLFYIAWQKCGQNTFSRKEFWAFAFWSLIWPIAWYCHAYLTSIFYPPHHIFGRGGIELVSLSRYGEILSGTALSSLTLPITAMAMIGLALPRSGMVPWVFHYWFLSIFLFMIIAGEGHRHEWYLLPVAPVAAALAGKTCDFALGHMPKPLRANTFVALISFLFFIPMAYVSFVASRPFFESWTVCGEVGRELNKILPRDALITIADAGNPTCLYYSNRKGWHFLKHFGSTPVTDQQAVRELENLREEGAEFLIFVPDTFWWLDSYPEFKAHVDSLYKRAQFSDRYIVFDLRARKHV